MLHFARWGLVMFLTAMTTPAQQEPPEVDIAALVAAVMAAEPAQDPQPALDPAEAGPAMRIWSHREVGMQDVWFRRTITLANAAKSGRLVFTCDNVATVFVNGKQVATSDAWEEITVVDITVHLEKGDNVIAIHAQNQGSCAALAAWVLWQDAAGKANEVVTDKTWRYSDQQHAGWHKRGFDASRWRQANATLATPYGKNTYAGAPRRVRFKNALSAPVDQIEAALERLRAAQTPEAAAKALDEIDRAVMRTRAALWQQRKK